MIQARLLDQWQVDAFADGPFTGNPAAVVFEHKDKEWMQKLANENNLAETAFVNYIKGSQSDYKLRW